jgi:hypothetical protein
MFKSVSTSEEIFPSIIGIISLIDFNILFILFELLLVLLISLNISKEYSLRISFV